MGDLLDRLNKKILSGLLGVPGPPADLLERPSVEPARQHRRLPVGQPRGIQNLFALGIGQGVIPISRRNLGMKRLATRSQLQLLMKSILGIKRRHWTLFAKSQKRIGNKRNIFGLH